MEKEKEEDIREGKLMVIRKQNEEISIKLNTTPKYDITSIYKIR